METTQQYLQQAARRAFTGSLKFRRWINAPDIAPDAATSAGTSNNADASLAEADKLGEKAAAALRRFNRPYGPLWVRCFAPSFGALSACVTGAILLGRQGAVLPYIMLAFVVACVIALYWVTIRSTTPQAKSIADHLARRRGWLSAAWEQAAGWHQSERDRIEAEFQATKNAVNQTWKQTTHEIAAVRNRRPLELEERIARLHRRNEQFQAAQLQRLQAEFDENKTRLHQAAEAWMRRHKTAHQTEQSKFETNFQRQWQTLAADWQTETQSLGANLKTIQAAAEKLFPDWASPVWNDWSPPPAFLNAVKFGQLDVDLEKFTGALPKDAHLALSCPKTLSLPLLLTHPQQGSLLFETGRDGGGEAVAAINNLILRLLATMPPGRVEFTIFDPVGLGQNFAALMHLADYEAGAINSRIWTQPAQFEEKLAALNEHMEKVIQMYLRNEYATITEYNAQAGSIAEKYHFLVIASFPVNFTDTAAKRLRNIAANGARCGVFTLVQWDARNAAPPDFVPDELRQQSVNLLRAERGFEFAGARSPGLKITLDAVPAPEFTTQLLHRIGRSGKDASRVEVPFEQVAPAPGKVWTEETSEELRVPVGRTGATKLQYLAVGRDTRQHALLAGKTGSGKSTLFHVIITNLALRCSPEQVEFYLVDFKKGVEFKCYATHRLPHAKVVAIESDRAFGLSVLQRVDEELRRRGDLFRQAGAQDLPGYKRLTGAPMPRTLLMIDEFQEFFVEEDRVSQNAAMLLDRIVRQGRAFGIHVILGSQTLGGAYTLARATIGQMAIRIALQCNEADAYLIMDQDNPAPRLLSRPGEGIYNDASGAIEGNSPFQAVWLSDRQRESYLAQIAAQAASSGKTYSSPIVFEGNAPADVRENNLLSALLAKVGQASRLPRERASASSEDLSTMNRTGETPVPLPPLPRFWLGAPNSIKGPTEVVFRRQGGSNLLIVGQGEERALALFAIGLISLAAQYPKDGAQFFVLHNLAADYPQTAFFQRALATVPQPVTSGGNAQLTEIMTALAAELKHRTETDAGGPDIFVFIHDLQNFKKLRQEDEFGFSSGTAEFSPAAALQELLANGPALGIHVLLACDSYGNTSRYLGRKTLGEIEMRVAFQMSASDSASLLDAPDAATLGLHRAVLFNEREGTLETFRPYALPGNDWLDTLAHNPK